MVDVHIEAGSENADISATETPLDTPQAPEQNLDAKTEIQEQSDQAAIEAPFKNGKEKFKFKDGEVEWDWATTRKYAELGRGGRLAMQRAAQLEKQLGETQTKAQATFSQLVHAAKTDPEGVLRMLGAQHITSSRGQAGQAASAQNSESADPRDQMIRELQAQLDQMGEKTSKFESFIENQAVEAERKAVETELESAIKQYPDLDTKHLREYVKSQYRRELLAGNESVTLEDVAFFVAEELKEDRIRKEQAKVKQAQLNRAKAPVTGSHGSSQGGERAMTREEVMKLAGRA